MSKQKIDNSTMHVAETSEKNSGFFDKVTGMFKSNKSKQTAQILAKKGEEELAELQAAYDATGKYISEAIAGKHANFDPSLDMAYYQSLEEKIQAARAEEESFRQNIRQKLLVIFSVLKLWAETTNPELKDDVEETMGSEQREVTFSAKIYQLVNKLQASMLGEHDEVDQLQKFVEQYQEKQKATTQAVQNSLISLQELIRDYVDRWQASLEASPKSPDDLEKEIDQLIKGYEGWKIGNSMTPASDRLSTELLLAQLQSYRTRYYDNEVDAILQRNKAEEQLVTLVDAMVHILASQAAYLKEKQLQLREKYALDTSDEKIDLPARAKIYQQTVTFTMNMWGELLQTLIKTRNFLTLPIGQHGYKLFLSNTILDHLDKLVHLDESVQAKQQTALTELRDRYEKTFQDYYESNKVNDIIELQQLQKSYLEIYATLENIRAKYKKLEYKIAQEGHKLSFEETSANLPELATKTGIPSTPIVRSWEDLIALYDGFTTSLGWGHVRLLGLAQQFNKEEQVIYEQAIKDIIFEQLVTNNDDTEKKYLMGDYIIYIKKKHTNELSMRIELSEQQKLVRKSAGRIVRHPDGTIDLPQVGITGLQLLASTEKSNPAHGIVHGDYIDHRGNTGTSGLTYMTYAKALSLTGEKGLQLLNLFHPSTKGSQKYEKYYKFIEQFGVNSSEQMKAIEVLFGKKISGCFSGSGWYCEGTLNLAFSRLDPATANVMVMRREIGDKVSLLGQNRLDFYPYLACKTSERL